MSNAIQITQTRRAVWDGRQFSMEKFNAGGKEVTNKDGSTSLTQPKWEGEQKYFTNMEGVVNYVARTESAETASDLNGYIRTFKQLLDELKSFVNMEPEADQ